MRDFRLINCKIFNYYVANFTDYNNVSNKYTFKI
jgi:hypothetical protein